MTSTGYQPRQPYEHLVVALDGSPEAERAVPYGKQLAQKVGATLHLLHVEAAEEPGDSGIYRHVKDLAMEVGALAEVRPMGADEVPAGALIDRFLGELGNATAVMATHGRGRVAAALLGSVTTKVVSAGHAVVAVGPSVSSTAQPITRVLACVDASSFSEQVVAEAAGWAKALGAALWMIEVVDPKVRLPDSGGEALQESSYVHRLAQDIKSSGLDIEWEVLHDGHAGRAIAAYAASEAGTLVALATHGRSGLRRAVVGSVAGDVLKNATVPVVLLQPQS